MNAFAELTDAQVLALYANQTVNRRTAVAQHIAGAKPGAKSDSHATWQVANALRSVLGAELARRGLEAPADEMDGVE